MSLPVFQNVKRVLSSPTGRIFQLAAVIALPFTTLLSPVRVSNMSTKTPVYFISHGGPPTMFDTKHPAFATLQTIGEEITQKVKPKAIVVFSAHWQSSYPNTTGVEINVAESEPLTYDYWGFPPEYYDVHLPNKGSKQLATRVMQLLAESGIRSQGVKRGLDHGIFVPFKIMFDPEKNPAGVPIVQVSTFNNEDDGMAHIRLGRAIQKLREEGVCIITSGMAVHNTRDNRVLMRTGSKQIMEYVPVFDEALKLAAEHKPGDERDNMMSALLQTRLGRAAHPTFEHLIPIHVGVGAAGDDQGKMLWTMGEGGLSWAQYRFGEVSA